MTHPVIQQLRRARREQKISGQALADAVGVSQSMVSLIENGGGDTMFRNVVAMADHLGFEVALQPRGGSSLTEAQAALVQLMADTVAHLPMDEQEVWEAELHLRRRQLGLEPTSRSKK
jgi:predicted transcriptional regulator